MTNHALLAIVERAAIIIQIGCIAAIVIGVAMIYLPAAFIVGGVLGTVSLELAARAQAQAKPPADLRRQRAA